MFFILNKQLLSKNIKRLEIAAKAIARCIQPGQFLIVIPQKNGGWIPLSVVESDKQRGVISIVFKEVGDATRRLGAMKIGDSLFSIIGPLGKPATINKAVGTVICLASGMGVVPILQICRAFRKEGNKVVGIIGARTRRDLVLEPQMRIACNKIYVSTEDGSFERRGNVIGHLKEVLSKENPNLVYAVGSADMMDTVCQLTKSMGIATLVQIHSLISCGLGRCGSCQIKVANKILLSCQHGPEFNGHEVDFERLKMRIQTYKEVRQVDGAEAPITRAMAESLKRFLVGT